MMNNEYIKADDMITRIISGESKVITESENSPPINLMIFILKDLKNKTNSTQANNLISKHQLDIFYGIRKFY